MTWQCHHAPDQLGSRRCVRCCIDRPKHYELLRPMGGTPARYRWLCNPCRAVYAALGMLAEHGRTYVQPVGGRVNNPQPAAHGQHGIIPFRLAGSKEIG